MNHLHWMKLYIGDELSNTAHMSLAEFGSYIFLKMHYWRFGQLPVEDDRLARIAKATAEQWAAMKPSIAPLFEENWRDRKLEAQREEAEVKHKARVEAGRKGGKSKKDDKQSLSNAYSKTKAGLKQPEPEPDPDPYSDREPERESDYWALDNEGDTNPREERRTFFTPLDPPASPKLAAEMLRARGVPPETLSAAVHQLMAGKLSEYDIEGFTNGEVLDETA